MNKKHIVILGGGFGGIYTYKSLPQSIKNSCNITIIDRRNHFLFTPLLPEVAGASLNQYSIIEPIRDIINTQVNFIQSTVESVNTKTNTIILPDKEITYDILVAGLGSTTQFFGTPGAEEYAYVLKTLDDAVTLRTRFIDILKEASQLDSKEERKKILSFMVVGAGPTGVELIAEASELIFNTLVKQFENITIDEVTFTLINSGEEILKMFDKKLRDYAARSLQEDNIIIKNNVRVAEITANGVITSVGESIASHTVIWAAGVTANNLTCSCGSFKSENGRILVDEYLRAENVDNVFVIGDMSLFPTEDGRGLPMTAQVAKQQGIITGKNIAQLLHKKSLEKFVYKEKGLLASLGSFDAIAQMKGVKIKGFIAWFMWRTIYLFNFASWKKRFKILFNWTLNLFSQRDITQL